MTDPMNHEFMNTETGEITFKVETAEAWSNEGIDLSYRPLAKRTVGDTRWQYMAPHLFWHEDNDPDKPLKPNWRDEDTRRKALGAHAEKSYARSHYIVLEKVGKPQGNPQVQWTTTVANRTQAELECRRLVENGEYRAMHDDFDTGAEGEAITFQVELELVDDSPGEDVPVRGNTITVEATDSGVDPDTPLHPNDYPTRIEVLRDYVRAEVRGIPSDPDAIDIVRTHDDKPAIRLGDKAVLYYPTDEFPKYAKLTYDGDFDSLLSGVFLRVTYHHDHQRADAEQWRDALSELLGAAGMFAVPCELDKTPPDETRLQALSRHIVADCPVINGTRTLRDEDTGLLRLLFNLDTKRFPDALTDEVALWLDYPTQSDREAADTKFNGNLATIANGAVLRAHHADNDETKTRKWFNRVHDALEVAGLFRADDPGDRDLTH